MRGAAGLHARLDAAKLRVQADMASAGAAPGPPRRRRRPARAPRAAATADRAMPPDRLSPPPRTRPGPRSPGAAPWPTPGGSSAAYVGAPAAELESPPEAVRYRELLLEQDAQSRQRDELLERLACEIGAAGTKAGEGGGTDRARALQDELAGQADRRQRLLGALQSLPEPPRSVPQDREQPVDSDAGSPRFTGLLDAVPERAERFPTPRAAPRSPAPQALYSPVQSPSRLPDRDDGNSPDEIGSNVSSDGDDAGGGGGPLDRGASEPDRAELAARLSSLWSEFRVAVRSPRDYYSVLTMIRDATADFWYADFWNCSHWSCFTGFEKLTIMRLAGNGSAPAAETARSMAWLIS